MRGVKPSGAGLRCRGEITLARNTCSTGPTSTLEQSQSTLKYPALFHSPFLCNHLFLRRIISKPRIFFAIAKKTLDATTNRKHKARVDYIGVTARKP